MSPPYFVWVQSLKGPTPEMWPELLRNMNGKIIPYLAIHPITDEEWWLGMDQLIKKYPAPEMENVE